MEFNINKGIGKSVEFKGLKAQYLFIFAAGLLAVFVVFVIMYMIGINQWVCIGFGVIAASVLVWMTFNLNTKYGRTWLNENHGCQTTSPLFDKQENSAPSIQTEKKGGRICVI